MEKQFNKENWYNQLYQEILKYDGKKEAEEALRIAKKEEWATPSQTPQEAAELWTM